MEAVIAPATMEATPATTTRDTATLDTDPPTEAGAATDMTLGMVPAITGTVPLIAPATTVTTEGISACLDFTSILAAVAVTNKE